MRGECIKQRLASIDCCRVAADATGDGIVNVSDAILILNVLIDADPEPVECELAD